MVYWSSSTSFVMIQRMHQTLQGRYVFHLSIFLDVLLYEEPLKSFNYCLEAEESLVVCLSLKHWVERARRDKTSLEEYILVTRSSTLVSSQHTNEVHASVECSWGDYMKFVAFGVLPHQWECLHTHAQIEGIKSIFLPHLCSGFLRPFQ